MVNRSVSRWFPLSTPLFWPSSSVVAGVVRWKLCLVLGLSLVTLPCGWRLLEGSASLTCSCSNPGAPFLKRARSPFRLTTNTRALLCHRNPQVWTKEHLPLPLCFLWFDGMGGWLGHGSLGAIQTHLRSMRKLRRTRRTGVESPFTGLCTNSSGSVARSKSFFLVASPLKVVNDEGF